MKLLPKVFFLFVFSQSILFGQSDSVFTQYRAAHIKELKKNFPDIKPQFFDFDQNWVLYAKVKTYKKNKLKEFPTSDGSIKTYRTYARLTFKINNKKHHLYCFQPSPIIRIYKNYLFLPIKDKTAPAQTYGGGRYLDLKVSNIENNRIKLDFNKLYNPLCSYDDAYSCPIPPPENMLKLKIEAGEKVPLKGSK